MRRATILATALTGTLSCAEPPFTPFAPSPDSSASAFPNQLEREITFAALGPTDQIVAQYSSKGCFHEYALRLVFTGEVDGVELTGEVLATNAIVPPDIPRRALRPAELAALDRLLTLYRSSTEQRCTNRDTIQLSLFSAGRLVRQEQYIDAACIWFEQPDVLTFTAAALAGRG